MVRKKKLQHSNNIQLDTTDNLNCRKGAGTNYEVETVINKGVAITIVAEKKLSDGSTWVKAKSGYWVNKKYMEFVRYV